MLSHTQLLPSHSCSRSDYVDRNVLSRIQEKQLRSRNNRQWQMTSKTEDKENKQGIRYNLNLPNVICDTAFLTHTRPRVFTNYDYVTTAKIKYFQKFRKIT